MTDHQLLPSPNDDVYRAVRTLRVVRRFRPDPVSPAHLDAILEAARWTGSAKNRQQWALVVIRDRERLDRLAECGDFTGPVRNAPLVIAPIRLPGGNEWDIGRLSQNIMLGAAALGVGSCPITLHREACGREVLGVPEDHGCRHVVALGYPDPEAEAEARKASPMSGRRPLDELVHEETFG